jgi:hypothetical protein
MWDVLGSILNRVYLKKNIYEGIIRDLTTPEVFRNYVIGSQQTGIEM